MHAGAGSLAAEVRGAGATVVLQHGFAQTRRCLGPLADALAQRRRVVATDAPGHGGSLRHAGADLPRGAELLVSTSGPATLLGYSMGGRLCLQAALDHPDRVHALVLISATAGIDDDEARAERRRSDDALAARLERLGLDAFIEEWLALPMFAGLPTWARFDQERRTNTSAGLAASLRHAGTGAMAPLWHRLAGCTAPVLCVTGEHDERYGALADRLVRQLGGPAHHAVVGGAGHAAHLERPDEVIELVQDFLDEHG